MPNPKLENIKVSGIKFIMSFFIFFTVALAWGIPFIDLLGINPSEAPDPNLARTLESLDSFLFWVPPFFAIIGIIVVAWLSKQAPSLSKRFALVLPALSMAAVGLCILVVIYFSDSADGINKIELTGGLYVALFISIFFGLTVLIPILGIIVTAKTLWRRNYWLSIAWVLGYVLTVLGVSWLSGRISAPEKDLGAGLSEVYGIETLLAVSFFASAIVSSITIILRRKKEHNNPNIIPADQGSMLN